MSKLQSIRGMRDILPEESEGMSRIEDAAKQCLHSFGYSELRLPLIESTALFERGVGDGTDIVEKEMFNIDSRDGEPLSLRPEGTAGCVRAAIQHGLAFNRISRLWYRGPMFRYERPQKGRYRQFEQIGAEAFGIAKPALDAELIDINHQLFARLGVDEHMKLRINTIGSLAERRTYVEALRAHLESNRDALDADSLRRLERSPLRILDSKHSETRAVIANAPKIEDFLDADSMHHFEQVLEHLQSLGIGFEIDPYLVRGLDYYTHTVFEFETKQLGAQGAVSAGGRYDGLVEGLGGRAAPGAGFAIGIDRLLLLCQSVNTEQASPRSSLLYCVATDEDSLKAMMSIGNQLRKDLAGVPVVVDTQGGKLGTQMRRADREGARWTIIAGESERAEGVLTLKPMREVGEQSRLKYDALVLRLLEAHGGLS
ncbi:MAG: histidine--tRNA ligase [Gammaproteobacteria bacterium]|nr:histidine--tRNA ligase [Gammaproteobacteria bacterium]MCY4277866.1 histidine--tRNA ligase [Gammaproteobacteria bacterium]MCY4322364.1 histidine--tRNA ligase [Gammaproteobacteria bacterium]